ncbi:putative holin-like toxin [Shouchella clausii]|nr:putative holin-like toxin [Shouchella clausii]MDO7285914.1 putative holin-like toxin [Shouchella clausii]MDO7305817.1 putative holin-like toxin [Shouchella clausii]
MIAFGLFVIALLSFKDKK